MAEATGRVPSCLRKSRPGRARGALRTKTAPVAGAWAGIWPLESAVRQQEQRRVGGLLPPGLASWESLGGKKERQKGPSFLGALQGSRGRGRAALVAGRQPSSLGATQALAVCYRSS